jgi:hypothetical protein
VTLPVIAVGDLAEAEQRANEEAQRGFDLTRGPIFRAALMRLSAEDHVLLLTLHHIAGDGWSMGVLVKEMSALYGAFAAGKPSPLPPLPVQYADFAYWQQQWLRDKVLERLVGYWKRQLGGPLPVLNLPTDHPRPANPTWQGASQSLLLPSSLVASLQSLGQREGATLFMILLAGFQTLLYRYTDQQDILVGSPIANRNRPEIDGLIGFFANTLVLRTDLAGDPPFCELLKRVRAVTLEAYTFQDTPFEQVVDALRPERDISRNPLFQVALVLQNAPLPSLRLPGLSITHLAADIGTARFDLMLSIVERENDLIASFEYSVELFDTATIVRMLNHFVTLLGGVVEYPEMRISELPLMTPEERLQSLSNAHPSKAIRPTRDQVRDLMTRLKQEQVKQS